MVDEGRNAAKELVESEFNRRECKWPKIMGSWDKNPPSQARGRDKPQTVAPPDSG